MVVFAIGTVHVIASQWDECKIGSQVEQINANQDSFDSTSLEQDPVQMPVWIATVTHPWSLL